MKTKTRPDYLCASCAKVIMLNGGERCRACLETTVAVTVNRATLVEQLAAAFTRELANQLTKQQWLTVCRRNRVETDPGVCHSHDYCDANMVMDAAFRSLGLDPFGGGDTMPDAMVDLWNDAWDRAKRTTLR